MFTENDAQKAPYPSVGIAKKVKYELNVNDIKVTIQSETRLFFA